MSYTEAGAGVLRKCVLAGVKNLENNQEFINELNVFPVPDGDTGTNMTMTMQTAVKEVLKLSETADISDIAKGLSSGSLRGARGNSGVILSQLIRGFCKVVSEKTVIDADTLSAAFKKASDTAYKAVMKPKEGTILTVAKGMAEKITELSSNEKDLEKLLSQTIAYGHEVLKKTPEMLPVLKEAGVVDSGGQGLMCFLDGALAGINNSDIELYDYKPQETAGKAQETVDAAAAERKPISTDDIKFGYCTECIINLNKPLSEDELSGLKEYLLSLGDSLVCVDDEELVKIHVHTNHPGLVFEKGLEFGSLSRLKVDNLHEEHEEKLIKDASKLAQAGNTVITEKKPQDETVENKTEKTADKDSGVSEWLNSFETSKKERKNTAVIAVCAGDGLSEIFKELGVDYCITGGQTMNPSTDDILNAIDEVNADNVIILPDNKNIILAAGQAKAICENSNVYVIPSKTVPQGITAMVSYDPLSSIEDNVEAMTEAISLVKTGEITHAVRNTQISGKEIKEGDIMGIGDSGILAVGQILNDTAFDMIKEMTDETASTITIYRGEDIANEDAEFLKERVENEYPDFDVELAYGGQPVYYYIISVE